MSHVLLTYPYLQECSPLQSLFRGYPCVSLCFSGSSFGIPGSSPSLVFLLLLALDSNGPLFPFYPCTLAPPQAPSWSWEAEDISAPMRQTPLFSLSTELPTVQPSKLLPSHLDVLGVLQIWSWVCQLVRAACDKVIIILNLLTFLKSSLLFSYSTEANAYYTLAFSLCPNRLFLGTLFIMRIQRYPSAQISHVKWCRVCTYIFACFKSSLEFL